MKRMIKTVEKEYGKAEAAKFDFITTSFVLPQEHALFQEEFKRNPGSIWIMKPVGKAQGKGIFLINKLSQISQWRKDPRVPNKNLGGQQTNADAAEAPEAYIVQKYIENPYLIGDIHATNVAIQKHSPLYDSDKGCKWLLRNLKQYMTTKHGAGPVNDLFTDIEALIVRSLMGVQKVMINDKHCFELYGYDILIDDKLKPWCLECNASPSLTAETQADYDLKHAMINDAFDVIDLEKKFVNEKKPRTKVGGFDLVYNDGPVKHERTTNYYSYLGCWQPIPKAPRTKKRLGHRASIKNE
ncbi:putative tubulin polyglutamylase ttll9 [Chytridiales sp. JEL 0842]|nr:putative tubulin polyglutamylase ttll9 [Chytridiales sp. JEL 0842]